MGVAVADVAEDAGRGHLREAGVDAEQPVGDLACHRGRDRGAPVAALGDVARVSPGVPSAPPTRVRFARGPSRRRLAWRRTRSPASTE